MYEDNEFFFVFEVFGDDVLTCGAVNDDFLLGVEDFVDFDEVLNLYVFFLFE